MKRKNIEYDQKEVMNLLSCCVRSKMNIIVGGYARSGKTELVNELSKSIPDEEKVISIQEFNEFRYSGSNYISIISKKSMWRQACAISLRLNASRVLLSELKVNSNMSKLFIEMASCGECCMTTINSSSIDSVLDRMYKDCAKEGEMYFKYLYDVIDLVVIMKRRNNGSIYVGDVGLIYNEDGVGKKYMVVEDGFLTKNDVPAIVKSRLCLDDNKEISSMCG